MVIIEIRTFFSVLDTFVPNSGWLYKAPDGPQAPVEYYILTLEVAREFQAGNK